MANGYSQSPAQGRGGSTSTTTTTTTTNGNEEEPYRFGDVSFVDETTGTQPPVVDVDDEPYVEDADATPSPILGQIKFQKTIYSKEAFRKKIDTSIGELIPKVEEVDIEKFFKDYYKIFFDIPQRGINSHSTIIRESMDFVSDYVDYKDEQISDLEQQVETLELQILELQQGSFDPETGESTGDDSISDLISEGEKQQRRLELIGDQTNPFIYWEPTDEYKDLGLGNGLENLRKYIGPEGGSASYPHFVLDGKKLEDYVNNSGRKQAYKDLRQAYEIDESNRRTYGQWITDIEKKSNGNRTDLLKALMVYVKNYQMDKLQAANNAG